MSRFSSSPLTKTAVKVHKNHGQNNIPTHQPFTVSQKQKVSFSNTHFIRCRSSVTGRLAATALTSNVSPRHSSQGRNDRRQQLYGKHLIGRTGCSMRGDPWNYRAAPCDILTNDWLKISFQLAGEGFMGVEFSSLEVSCGWWHLRTTFPVIHFAGSSPPLSCLSEHTERETDREREICCCGTFPFI